MINEENVNGSNVGTIRKVIPFKISELERHIQGRFSEGFKGLFKQLVQIMKELKKFNIDDKGQQTELTAIAIDENVKKLQDDKKDLTDELTILNSQLHEQTNTIEQLSLLNEGLEAKHHDTTNRLTRLKEEFDALEHENVDLTSHNKALKNHVDFLQTSVTKLRLNL